MEGPFTVQVINPTGESEVFNEVEDVAINDGFLRLVLENRVVALNYNLVDRVEVREQA